MSVLIKDMEMPKTCKQCLFSRYILGEWFCRTTTTLDEDGEELWESVGKFGNLHRPHWCPLVPVPPHGSLIDADGEIGVNVTMMPGGKCKVDLIAPTIIPAGGDE